LPFLVLDSSQSTESPFPFLSAFSSSFQKPHWRSRPITAQQQQLQHNQQQQQQGRWRSQPLTGVYDVVAYGAVGDAVADDTHALTTAMHAACTHAVEKGVVATVLVPWGGCYAVQPITMQGPCGPGMRLQIDGVLVGPSDPAVYPFPDYTSTYFPYTSGFLSFKNFSGLVISGGGRIDGQGWEFWKAFRNYTLQKTIPIRPFAIRLMHCKNTTVEGISIWNSPMYHLFAYTCDGLHIRRYKTNSPSRSPNTDSLKLVGIKNALIEDCFLHGGDDDVSIVAVGELVAYNITVRNLEATAGHGISSTVTGTKIGRVVAQHLIPTAGAAQEGGGSGQCKEREKKGGGVTARRAAWQRRTRAADSCAAARAVVRPAVATRAAAHGCERAQLQCARLLLRVTRGGGG
ncbi:unnamed protein product, partial [Closterium sp. Naga37s-1]